MSAAEQSATATTLQIVSIVFFTFISFLCIGLPLAVLPGYVHNDLGYGSLLAGIVISTQYASTLLSRPVSGGVADRQAQARRALRTRRLRAERRADPGLHLAAAVSHPEHGAAAGRARRPRRGPGPGGHRLYQLGHRPGRRREHGPGDFLERHRLLRRGGPGRAAGCADGLASRAVEHGRADHPARARRPGAGLEQGRHPIVQGVRLPFRNVFMRIAPTARRWHWAPSASAPWPPSSPSITPAVAGTAPPGA